MSVETKILQALQTAALTAIDAMPIPLAVKTFGRTSIKDASNADYKGSRWLEFVHIPNNPSDTTWGSEKDYQGNFRIILHWEIDDAGPYEPMAYIDALAELLPKQASVWKDGVRVQLYKNPTASGMIQGEGDLLFPLTLAYRCFRQ